MSKAIVVIKSMGIGDLCILISSIHAISNKIDKPVSVLAPKNTHARAIFKYDPHINEIIDKLRIGISNYSKNLKN